MVQLNMVHKLETTEVIGAAAFGAIGGGLGGAFFGTIIAFATGNPAMIGVGTVIGMGTGMVGVPIAASISEEK